MYDGLQFQLLHIQYLEAHIERGIHCFSMYDINVDFFSKVDVEMSFYGVQYFPFITEMKYC